MGFFTGHPMLKQIGKTFTILIAINLFFNMFNLSSVNIWSHVGGAVGGLLLAPV
ncbi:rhomboid family intramembrane serine protease, partial [Agathobacter rectalis]|uniref:rhomboid family intramembrane serine protease n=1 Tax=Agathobacter rectalis TaxID=39491 RepID=UPI003B528C4A